MQKPFIWGPIGGLENSPWRFLPSLGFKGMVYYTGRNLLNLLQQNFKFRSRKAAKTINSELFAATPGNAKLISKLWGRDAPIICEVGQEKYNFLEPNRRKDSEPLKIIWSGWHTPGKNLSLLLKALTKVQINFELHILGQGEKTSAWLKMAKKLGVNKYCIWHGRLNRDHAMKIMQSGHVFCITSVSDLTSTVTMEAISFGLPIICLDHFGFKHVVTEECGIKIPINTPIQAAVNFKTALESLYHDEEYRQKLSQGAIRRANDFSWDKKIKKVTEIYNALLIRNT